MPEKPTCEELVQRVRGLEKAESGRAQPDEAVRNPEELVQLFVKHTPAAGALREREIRYPS